LAHQRILIQSYLPTLCDTNINIPESLVKKSHDEADTQKRLERKNKTKNEIMNNHEKWNKNFPAQTI
jgi:hypothetical protein